MKKVRFSFKPADAINLAKSRSRSVKSTDVLGHISVLVNLNLIGCC